MLVLANNCAILHTKALPDFQRKSLLIVTQKKSQSSNISTTAAAAKTVSVTRDQFVELEKKKINQKTIMKAIDGFVSIANTFVKFGSLPLMALFCYWMVDSLAGKQTDAKIGIEMLFDSRVLGAIFGTSGVLYGIYERRLRRKTVQHVQPRVKQLEERLDVNRTSSKLTPAGDTNPEDE